MVDHGNSLPLLLVVVLPRTKHSLLLTSTWYASPGRGWLMHWHALGLSLSHICDVIIPCGCGVVYARAEPERFNYLQILGKKGEVIGPCREYICSTDELWNEIDPSQRPFSLPLKAGTSEANNQPHEHKPLTK